MSNPGPASTSTSNERSLGSTPDGHLIGETASDPVGFFGTTPVVQPASPAGNVHTPTAGSTTAAYVNTTYDGSVGSTAYTVGDIVKALKTLGLIAS